MNSPSVSLKFLLLGLAALLAVASWCGYWLYVSREAQARIAAFETHLQEDGIVVDCAGRSWGGFPFRVVMRCAPLSVRATAEAGLVIARAAFLAQAYDLDHIIVVADSPAEVRRPGGVSRIGFASAVGSYIANAGDFAIEARNLSIDVPGYGNDEIDRWSANGSLDEGAAVAIHGLELASGDVLVRGKGRFDFDSAARPHGRIGLEIINLRRLLDRLAAKGVITAGEIEAGLAFLTLLGEAAGGAATIDLRAEHGRLYFGPFKLGELPPLR